jgi:hypothetical protein
VLWLVHIYYHLSFHKLTALKGFWLKSSGVGGCGRHISPFPASPNYRIGVSTLGSGGQMVQFWYG